MIYIYIIIGIILLTTILILLIKSYLNKVKVYVIKIDEADKNIDLLLEKKLELFKNIKEKTKDTLDIDILEDIPKIKGKNLDSFEKDKAYEDLENDIKDTLIYNKKIILDSELQVLIDSLKNTNIDLKATKKYYNDNADLYNEKVNKFPKRIIARIKGYDEIDYYETKEQEEFEILKEKN